MLSLIKNEVFKIIKQKKLYIFMGLILVFNVLQYIGFLVIKATDKEGKFSGLFTDMNGQTFPINMLSEIGTLMIIYIAVLMADIVTDEYKNGTLKLSLLRPVTRLQLLVSKAAGLLVGIIVLMVFTLISSYILGTVFFGWGSEGVFNGVIYNDAGDIQMISRTLSTAQSILYVLGSYLLTVLPYFAFGMVILMIALLFTNMGATIAASLGIWIAMSVLTGFIEQVRSFVINTYYTFYMQFLMDLDVKRIAVGFIVIILYSSVFFAISNWIFKKKDILL